MSVCPDGHNSVSAATQLAQHCCLTRSEVSLRVHRPAAAPLPPHSLPPDWRSLDKLRELRIIHEAAWAAELEVWNGEPWGGFTWGTASLSTLTSLTKLQLSSNAILPGKSQHGLRACKPSCKRPQNVVRLCAWIPEENGHLFSIVGTVSCIRA